MSMSISKFKVFLTVVSFVCLVFLADLSHLNKVFAAEPFFQDTIVVQRLFGSLISDSEEKINNFCIAEDNSKILSTEQTLPGDITPEKNMQEKTVSQEESINNNIPEKTVPKVPSAPIQKKAVSPAGGNVGKPGPILVKTETKGGKRVCKDIKKDHPGKSKNNKKGHIDAECCLDLDETPNSLCYYPPEKYGKLIQKYLDKKK